MRKEKGELKKQTQHEDKPPSPGTPGIGVRLLLTHSPAWGVLADAHLRPEENRVCWGSLSGFSPWNSEHTPARASV